MMTYENAWLPEVLDLPPISPATAMLARLNYLPTDQYMRSLRLSESYPLAQHTMSMIMERLKRSVDDVLYEESQRSGTDMYDEMPGICKSDAYENGFLLALGYAQQTVAVRDGIVSTNVDNFVSYAAQSAGNDIVAIANELGRISSDAYDLHIALPTTEQTANAEQPYIDEMVQKVGRNLKYDNDEGDITHFKAGFGLGYMLTQMG